MLDEFVINKLIFKYKEIINDTENIGSEYWSIAVAKFNLLRELRRELQGEFMYEVLLNNQIYDQYQEQDDNRVY